MAIITRECSSAGANVIFTIDDQTLRVTGVEVNARSRQMRVVLFDSQGRQAVEISPTLNTRTRVDVDVPARLVEIEKSDQTIKSYVCPHFVVSF